MSEISSIFGLIGNPVSLAIFVVCAIVFYKVVRLSVLLTILVSLALAVFIGLAI